MSGLKREFASFLIVGVVATACHYLLLIFLVEALNVAPVPASAAGAFLGAVVSYYLNRRLTFRSTRKHTVTAPRFFTVAGISLVTNTALMALFTGPLGWGYLISQIITTVFLILITFGANKLWTFGRDEET
ncbi:MAG: GtrA family protein [Hyphomicrobiales bacterium]